MHGCNSGFTLLVNAEVDSMGGVVDGGVGIGIKTSPRRAAIEKALTELRQEYDVREERRRELEFLEKGGNPLDFKFGNAASISVQSTSQMDQHPEQYVTSEAKGSCALTASPRGDSVESSDRPGAPTVCEPNSADNLLLFDGDNEILEVRRNPVHNSRSNIPPSVPSSQVGKSKIGKESGEGESDAFGVPKNQAYRRRNRSRPNREGTRSSSTDIAPSRGGNVSSTLLLSSHGLKDALGPPVEANNLDLSITSNSNTRPTSSNSSMCLKAPSDNKLGLELDGARAVETASGPTNDGLCGAASDINVSKNLWGNQQSQKLRDDVRGTPVCVAPEEPESGGGEQVSSASLVPRGVATTKGEHQTSVGQHNGLSNKKGLDSELSCTQTRLRLHGKNDTASCNNVRNIESNGITKEQNLVVDGVLSIEGDDMVKEESEMKVDDNCAIANSGHRNQGNGFIPKVEEDLPGSVSVLQNEIKYHNNIEVMEMDGVIAPEAEMKDSNMLGDDLNPHKKDSCTGRLQDSTDSSVLEQPETTAYFRGSTVAPQQQTCSEMQLKLANKAHEDSILEEARIIEAKRKRIAELSVGTLSFENRLRSHWDFVLEEMHWLANDFAQERLWKITAAAQISRRVSFASRLRSEGQMSCYEQKKVAHILAKAVMEFWHSAEETSTEPELHCPGKKLVHAVQGYAVRFLKSNNFNEPSSQAEAPLTPDRVSDLGILDMSWEDHLTEETLFYTVLPGAMETYRKSIESHALQCEKTGSSIQEEVDTSINDAIAGSQENAYEEDEGETSTYLLPGAHGMKVSKFAQKKRKNFPKSYAARSNELGPDLAFTQFMENKVRSQQSVLLGKRPVQNLTIGSVPTKRVRTASRQRVLGPFSAGTSGSGQAPCKTDASSGDTNSCQDDQSTLHGGSVIPNSLEVDSVGKFEKHLPFDSSEPSNRPKKKKKAKYLGSTNEQRWQIDSNFSKEQSDHPRKRLDSHLLESNGSGGFFGQHSMKKPKMMKQTLDNSFDELTPMADSISSPVASQMSNMPNPSKFIKMLGGRDRGRKAKALKMAAGQHGSGSPWSLFEDQALVVLVHDMGPNWNLVSDAMNSTLQFKCIFRKPKECRERHKILMDRTTDDGADSAEDSGSSQPYPSTLPGIPKGSARQLFQRLQGPMEEDTLKAHFEKIIVIGQSLHYRRTQNDVQNIKQIQPHNSHAMALSQVLPNHLNGGPPLSPLDLCDASASNVDVNSLGHQGSQNSGLAASNQGAVASALPSSGANSPLQGSSGMLLGSNMTSSPGPLNSFVRDGRYFVPRSASLSIEEQQRMQQYNHMLPNRNNQQSLPAPGALPGTERGVRILPSGNGMGTVCGVTRSMPMARPGYQGVASSSVMNSGSMLSSSMVGVPSSVNMHSGAGSGQGNSMLRHRDALHMMRPNQNPEHQRQMMLPEIHMQATQANSQGVPGYGGLSSEFSNQTVAPPVQTYPLHHPQQHQLPSQQSHVLGNSHQPHLQGPSHANNSQHQAYALRLAKERHMQQQRLLQQQQQQQQQQFAATNGLMPHVQSQPQVPISSSLQNSSQIQSQTSSSLPVSMSPLTPQSPMTPISQHQQKHHMFPHGVNRNPQAGGSGLNNQLVKQRQRHPQQQQFTQSGRHQPQQQSQQTQQQAKILKGVGRGNMLMHQNISVDPSLLNGLSTTPGNQSAEKGDQAMHLIHGQGLYTGSGQSPVHSSKHMVPGHASSHFQSQQKFYPGQAISSSKQLQQMPSHPINSNQDNLSQVNSGSTPSAHQAVPPSSMASSNHQQSQPQPQPQQKLVDQTQSAVQRVLQQNHHLSSDVPSKSQLDQVQSDKKLPAISSCQMDTKVAAPQGGIGTSNSAPQSSPMGSSNSGGTDRPTSVSQGLRQNQSSGSLHSLGHDGGMQRPQSQLQSPHAPSPPPQHQQQ